jgi:hypothetical protein
MGHPLDVVIPIAPILISFDIARIGIGRVGLTMSQQ